MHKRALAVVGIAVAAGAALQFGLPTGVAATGPTYTTISMKPLPIEQPGTLAAGGTVTMCVQPLNGGAIVSGAVVFLSIDSGLFTTPPTAGGSATAQGTPLTSTPATFTVQPTCNWANAEGSGSLSDAVPVTYTAPNPALVHGRDVIAAESDNSSFDLATGQCTGPGICNIGTYVFSPVANYQISNVPIATTGSLGAGQQVMFTVTAVDNSATPKPVPGAFLLLSLTSSAAAGGTATGVNSFSGFPKEKITNTPNRFGSDSGGSVLVTYTAANPLPSTGVDTITAQNHPTPTFTPVSTTYTYGAVVFSQAPYMPVTPFRVCDTRPAGGTIPVNQCNQVTNPAGHGPLTSGATRVITIDGFGGVPAGSTAVVVNVTAVDPSTGTFLSLTPDGVHSSQRTSNLNPAGGTVLANLVEVAVSSAGKIDVFNSVGTVNIILDIEGFVKTGAPGFFNATSPTRICDTRVGGIAPNQCNSAGAATHPIAAGAPLTINVDGFGSPPVPTSGVFGVVFNLTAIAPTRQTVLRAYAAGTTAPNASNVNLNAGATLPNRVMVPVTCSAGHCKVTIANSVGSVNVAVDLNGWFGASGTQFSSLTPARLCDTRSGNGSDQGCAKGMIAAGHVLNINVTGIDGLPPLGDPHVPVALVANVTAVNATSGTYISVYPGPNSTTHPTVSDLNVAPGGTFTNLVVVKVGSDGTINLFNAGGNINLIVDILGYYSA